jgi:hypothetical protein
MQEASLPPAFTLLSCLPYSTLKMEVMFLRNVGWLSMYYKVIHPFVLSLHLPGEIGKSSTFQPAHLIPMRDMTQVPPTCECTTELLKSNVYNCRSPSICLAMFFPNGTPQEILVAKTFLLERQSQEPLLLTAFKEKFKLYSAIISLRGNIQTTFCCY